MNLSTQTIAAAKNIVAGMQENTKLIDCLEHPGQHKVVMSVWPAEDAGFWQCTQGEGFEDYHDCVESAAEGKSEYEVDTTEVPSVDSRGEYQGYEQSFYTCAGDEGCGRAIDINIADPAVDAAEARADYEGDL
jgi:hypothetical protein